MFEWMWTVRNVTQNSFAVSTVLIFVNAKWKPKIAETDISKQPAQVIVFTRTMEYA